MIHPGGFQRTHLIRCATARAGVAEHIHLARLGLLVLRLVNHGIVCAGAQRLFFFVVDELRTVFFAPQPGSHDGHAQAIAHIVIVSSTKNNGSVLCSVAADGVHDLAGLAQLEVATSGDIYKDTTSAIQIHTLEQWASNGLFGSDNRAVFTGSYGGTHHRLTLFAHDGLDVLKVNVDVTFYVDFEDVKTDRKSTRLNSSHVAISYAVFCLRNK